MNEWLKVECGFDAANETINFGTRTLAEGDALYETTTLATIGTDSQTLRKPFVQCLNKNSKIYIAIDTSFRIFSNNCENMDVFTTFECFIDAFCVSEDDNLVLLCLNDGNIHCLHVPSGGKLVCSEKVSEGSLERCFLSAFPCVDDNDQSSYIICAKSNVFRLQINKIAKIYEDIVNEIEQINVDYTFEKIDDVIRNSGIIEIEYNNLFVTSSVYKRCYNNDDPFIIALNKDGYVIGICKMSKIALDICNEESYEDLIFLKSSNLLDHRMVVLITDDNNSFVRLLSYPKFETIYNIKVSETTYLVTSNSDQDEVMFIEGACVSGSLNINELRIKVITESNPVVKLQRLLKRKCFEEAKDFAKKYELSLQSIFQAEAEEFIVKADFQVSHLKPFCEILDNIDDIGFVVECCINTTPDTLEGIEHLLDYAHKRINILIENNPDDQQFFEYSGTVLRISYKLETFKILHSNLDVSNDSKMMIDKWTHFSYIDFFDEMCNYLKNGKIDKCTVMFNRLHQQDYDLDDSLIANMIKTMPVQTPLMELTPLLRHMIIYCSENLPKSLPLIIKWVYNTIVHFNISKPNGLEYIFNFAKYIQSFLFTSEFKCLHFHQYNLGDGCLTKFRKLMNSLNEMVTIRNEFNIKISIIDYIQEPIIVAYLLLDKVMSNHLNNFINKFFLEFCCNNHLNVDDVLSEYIKKLSCNEKGYWEETGKKLVSYINSNSTRMDIILIMLEAVDVPWTKFMEDFADDASKEYPTLAEKIKLKRDNIPWKILLKKYDIPQSSTFDDDEVKLIIRRILLLSKPDELDDLNIIVQRYQHLKESCSILSFNHFVQIGNCDAAVNCIKKLPPQTLKRCFNLILIQVRQFLFTKHPFYNMLQNHVDILFSLLYLLEANVPEYEYEYYSSEAIKLKNIYLLKKYFTCDEIQDENFKLSTLLEKLIGDIIVGVNSNKYNWSEAVNKCETISHLIGVKKEQMFAELISRVQNLEVLIQIARNMIEYESKPIDMCEIALTIMRSIGIECNSDLSLSLSSSINSLQGLNSSHSHTVEALKVIHNLARNACINADAVDLLVPCAILNWINACYSLQLDKLGPQWTITPVYKPDSIAIPSARTVTILNHFFNTFITIAETRVSLPIRDKQNKTLNESGAVDDIIIECIESLPDKIQQLHVEGYDIVSYQLLKVLKNEILCSNLNVKFTSEAKNRINFLINSMCVSQLLYKLFVQNDIDQHFALSLFLQPKFDPMKWTLVAIKKYKNNVKKLSAAANLACSYLEMKDKSGPYDAYFNLRNRCLWRQKFLHECVSYKDTFQLDPDQIITEYLFKSEKFTLKLLQQFCTDFNLNVQIFLPLYLRYSLLQWKPDIEIVKDPTLGLQEKLTENGPFSKCKDIIHLLENKKAAVDQLNSAWNEISYYQYEVYLCILDLLEVLDQKCFNPESRVLLIYLRRYVRIKKPQQKEIDDWQAKYPFSREIDPLSEYRLPYLLEMFTKDLWEIIRPEINLLTYDRWFETAAILQLNQDDICTYAIKGTIYSGIFNSNEIKWSVSSKHDGLLKSLEECVSKIINLEIATAALYQATCKVSGGADQVVIAKMCWKKAIHWKKSDPKTSNMNDVLMKVQRKYLNCVSMHILFTHNLGVEKYLSLIEHTEALIRNMYKDESIIRRTKGTIMYYPDINSAVDEFGKQLGIDVNEIRKTLIMELLQESEKNVNFNEVKNHSDLDNISDNLKRIIYICESNATDEWTTLLFNISFSKLDETISEFVTSTDLSMQIKALQCLLVIGKNNDKLEEYIGQSSNTYVAKLQILLTLESIGYSLTVHELDGCNKSDLINKILQSNSSNPLIIKSLSKLLSLYHIWDSTVWNIIIKYFIKLLMLPELQEWLPKLYKICYLSGVQCNYTSGWECLITNTFMKTIHHHSHFTAALHLLQICPIIYKLDSCLLNIFNRYFENKIYEICAMLIPYLNEENKNKSLQILKSHRNNELYDKINKLSFQGILNTDCAINILKKL